MSPLSLSFFHPAKNKTRGNKERKVEREGEVKERETDGHVERERKQDRMKMSDLMLLCACQDLQSAAGLIDRRGGWNLFFKSQNNRN